MSLVLLCKLFCLPWAFKYKLLAMYLNFASKNPTKAWSQNLTSSGATSQDKYGRGARHRKYMTHITAHAVSSDSTKLHCTDRRKKWPKTTGTWRNINSENQHIKCKIMSWDFTHHWASSIHCSAVTNQQTTVPEPARNGMARISVNTHHNRETDVLFCYINHWHRLSL